MKDVMIDFEALGNGHGKALCQIGAVYFDNVTGALGNKLKINIDAASHAKKGGVVDAQVVYWWLQQSDEARKSILEQPRVAVEVAMITLNEFLKPAKRVWSHLAYDFVTLMDTFKQLSIEPSVSYKSGMDIRTLIYLSGLSIDKTKREGVHHDGLDDAIFQVSYCVKALNIVRMNKKALSMLKSLED